LREDPGIGTRKTKKERVRGKERERREGKGREGKGSEEGMRNWLQDVFCFVLANNENISLDCLTTDGKTELTSTAT